MKKIFTFAMALLFVHTAMAYDFFRLPTASQIQAGTIDSIKILKAAQASAGVGALIWTSDTTISKYFVITLCQYDQQNVKIIPFCQLAAPVSSFDLAPTYPGYFGTSTNIVTQYGNNYSDLAGAPDSTITQWKAAWEASVNETDNTLKPGAYVVYVMGYDATLQTAVAVPAYTVINITSAEAIDNVEATKATEKFIRDGVLYIRRGDKLFDLRGQQVK